MTVGDLRKSVVVGAVCYFSDPNISSGEPHYNVLLNDPKSENQLVFIPATTLDIWSAQSAGRFPRETIVDVTEKDCPFLNRPSLFDCNRPIVRHVAALAQKFSASGLKVRGQASADVVKRLIRGLKSSKLVSPKVKKLVPDP